MKTRSNIFSKGIVCDEAFSQALNSGRPNIVKLYLNNSKFDLDSYFKEDKDIKRTIKSASEIYDDDTVTELTLLLLNDERIRRRIPEDNVRYYISLLPGGG